MKLPVLAAHPVERISAFLQTLDEPSARVWFGSPAVDRVLKTTVGLCPTCLAYAPALVYERDGRVFGLRRCATHGDATAVWENDARWYALSNKDRSGRRYVEDKLVTIPELGGCCDGGACGDVTDQLGNKTCTILVEVTDACNLACAVCYADSKGDRYLPLADFQARMLALLAQKGTLDSVQLTGGEASLHPQFLELVGWLHAQEGVRKIYLPTNGLRLPPLVPALAAWRDKLMVLLQFDSVADAPTQRLRNATPASIRARVVDACGEVGLHVQLTMTVDVDTNLDDVRAVVAVGRRHDHVKVIAIQPATGSGRYALPLDPLRRATLSDIVKAVDGGLDQFKPIPCSHPNCGWISLYARRFGLSANITRHVDLDAVMNRVAYKTLLSTDELRGVLGATRSFAASVGRRLVRSTDVFTVAIKPFMDRHTYDQDRVANCCHHLMDTRGVPTSFCEYNALLRPKDSWERFPVLPG